MNDEKTASMFAEPAPKPKAYMPFPPALAPHANEVDMPAPAVRLSVPTSSGVVVERVCEHQFVVQRARHGGTTYAEMTWTRAELEQLVIAASEALR